MEDTKNLKPIGVKNHLVKKIKFLSILLNKNTQETVQLILDEDQSLKPHIPLLKKIPRLPDDYEYTNIVITTEIFDTLIALKGQENTYNNIILDKILKIGEITDEYERYTLGDRTQ